MYTKNISRLCFLAILNLCSVVLFAQIPAGYYSGAKGKSGKALKTALHNAISSHTARSYDNLWDDYKTTDVRPDGKIWDMYSNITSYVPGGSAQGKNYSKEGDAYNREHSFPKSWFNDAKPMYTDLFHVYPTDGYCNGRRSNYPFGETNGETWQSSGGFSKLGKCTVSGYSGTVFEPADEYKGDFARSYFYMATCYEDKIASWSSPMLSGDSYTAYTSWALQMLLRWAAQDPVSEKEIARNNAVYGIQKNRNPFIDFPGLEQYVWGSLTSTPFDPDNYEGGGGGSEPLPDLDAPAFSLPSGSTVEVGTKVTITCETAGATIFWRINSDDWQTGSSPVEVTINRSCTLSAYAFLGTRQSEVVSASYSVPGGLPTGERTYTLLTDEKDLVQGLKFLIVCPDKNVALSSANNNVRTSVSVEFDDAAKTSLTTEVSTSESLPYELELRDCGQSGKWSIFCAADVTWLGLTSSDNKLHSLADNSSEDAWWTISLSSNSAMTYADILSPAHGNRAMRYNSGAPRFACYTSGQQPIAIYAYDDPTSSVRPSVADAKNGAVRVVDAFGRTVRILPAGTTDLSGLPAGFYVVGNKKVIVK
ncbi:MAG: endonuclease [Alloprevotella sp.]